MGRMNTNEPIIAAYEPTLADWQAYCEAFAHDANEWDHVDACPVCHCSGGCVDACPGIECASCGGDPARCDCVGGVA